MPPRGDAHTNGIRRPVRRNRAISRVAAARRAFCLAAATTPPPVPWRTSRRSGLDNGDGFTASRFADCRADVEGLPTVPVHRQSRPKAGPLMMPQPAIQSVPTHGKGKRGRSLGPRIRLPGSSYAVGSRIRWQGFARSGGLRAASWVASIRHGCLCGPLSADVLRPESGRVAEDDPAS